MTKLSIKAKLVILASKGFFQTSTFIKKNSKKINYP